MTDNQQLRSRIEEALKGCEVVTPGPWSSAGQEGTPSFCYLAQVFGADGKGLLDLHSTDNPAVATANAAHIARCTPDFLREVFTLALSALDGAGSGWRLVPIEPTQAMLRAGREGPELSLESAWKRMFAASPSPPAPEAK